MTQTLKINSERIGYIMVLSSFPVMFSKFFFLGVVQTQGRLIMSLNEILTHHPSNATKGCLY